jgi:diaminopimelate epimerase
MEFTKIQGAANDFVLVDAREIQGDWQELAKVVCDRHLGVGADSLLLLLNSKKADFYLRTFDTDGSEAEICGNGIRCLARYALDTGLIETSRKEITVETLAGTSRVFFEEENGRVTKFRANMGSPRLSGEEIAFSPAAGNGNITNVNSMLRYSVSIEGIDLNLNLVSMGNPHAIHFCREPVEEFPLSVIGTIVENLPVFLNRANFMIARVLDKDLLEARSWERGVGETLACGSGACAITVASKLSGYTGERVDIRLPGGTLNTEWNGSNEVILGGPAEIVFRGNWPD